MTNPFHSRPLSDGKPKTPCCGAPYFFRMSSEGNGYRCEKCGKLLDLPNMGRIMPAQAEKKVNAFYGKRQPPSARDFVKKRLCEVEEMEQAWEADKRQWMEEGARKVLKYLLQNQWNGTFDGVEGMRIIFADRLEMMLIERDYGFPVDER